MDRRESRGWLAVLGIVLLCLVGRPVLAEDGAYRLGVGDRVAISVLGEPGLSVEATIDDTGTIAYPFLGSLPVRGLSVEELRERVVAGLKPDFLRDPHVTVGIAAYRNFYISGEVQKPGGFPWQPGMTVRMAAALAGGFSDRAARNRITVIREADPVHATVPVDVDAPVLPGDVVTVGQGFF